MRKWLVLLLAVCLGVGLMVPVSLASPTRTLTVVFTADRIPADFERVIQAAGGRVTSRVDAVGVAEVEGPAALLELLHRRPDVMAASPAIGFALPQVQRFSLEPNPAALNVGAAALYHLYQWDIQQVTSQGASWNLGTGSHQTVVAVVDTGINTLHQDLSANLLGGRNFVPDGPGGTINPTDIHDRHGHGSHVAGTIAGNGLILGVGPNLGIRAYRIFGASGGAPSSRVVQAIIAAADDGADVINLSLGGYSVLGMGYWTDPETGITYRFKDVADFVAFGRAIRYAVNRGAVVVAAAGNDAINITNPAMISDFLNQAYGGQGFTFQGASRVTPGTLAGVLSVAATAPDLSRASYSNFGPGAIDLSAPGGDFTRFPQAGWHLDMTLSANAGSGADPNGYAFMAGTSMAAPKVSAVAALLLDQAKQNGSRLNPQQVGVKLKQTAVGDGMVNAYTALGGQ